MKKIGIWIDKREAKIIAPENDSVSVIYSNLEELNDVDGSETRIKDGPQEMEQERKYHKSEELQFEKFFDRIVEFIVDAESIVILGPAQTGLKLKKELAEKHPSLYKKVVGVKKTNQMTDKHLIAWVKNYYSDEA